MKVTGYYRRQVLAIGDKSRKPDHMEWQLERKWPCTWQQPSRGVDVTSLRYRKSNPLPSPLRAIRPFYNVHNRIEE
jgi:hypothetical protein